MFRWPNNKIIAVSLLGCVAAAAALGAIYQTQILNSLDISLNGGRAPAALSTNDLSQEQINKAEWSVSAQDFESSDPGRGRSYFDYVFSRLNSQTDKRIYDIPYPFEKVLERVDQYLGYGNPKENNSSLQKVLFPLGRSLQRNAALGGSSRYEAELFFKFPRIVVGVDKEPKAPFALNLKGRFFLGFHEKAKVIEAISYNDEEGRYEYQIVRDYDSGKTPKVVYANRQVCLSCHQNQTPIFSNSPWNESNAHPSIFSRIETQLHSDKYFGAPTRVDLSVPYSLDLLVEKGNYYHAFHKMWGSVCGNLNCQRTTIKLLMRYLLSGQEALKMTQSEKDNYLISFENEFKKRFPYGMKIPDPKIPNRDPLKDRQKSQADIDQILSPVENKLRDSLHDLIARSSVSGEFEPLRIRPPQDIWFSSEPDERNTNKMILGFAEFFTQQDILNLDGWLKRHFLSLRPSQLAPTSMELQSKCEIQKNSQGEDLVIQISCAPNETSSLALQKGYFLIRKNQKFKANPETQEIQIGILENLLLYSGNEHCDRRAVQSLGNRANGIACPGLLHVEAAGSLKENLLSFQLVRANSGLGARLLDGRLVSRASLDLTTGMLKVSILDDIAFLDKIIDSIPLSIFSRKSILKFFSQGFGVEYPDFAEKMNTLEKNLEIETFTSEQILKERKNPMDSFSQSCGMCHSNFEGVPPNFLGTKIGSLETLNSLEKCQRIEICAPRMLYRLKMRNCSETQMELFQKNPMPLPHFFKITKVNVDDWQKTVAPRLTQFLTSLVRPKELERAMISQGVGPAKAQNAVAELLNENCPNVDYKDYESLPRCEFSRLKLDSQCESSMSASEKN